MNVEITLNDLMNQVVENSQDLLRCDQVIIEAATAELKKLHTLETETSNQDALQNLSFHLEESELKLIEAEEKKLRVLAKMKDIESQISNYDQWQTNIYSIEQDIEFRHVSDDDQKQ